MTRQEKEKEMFRALALIPPTPSASLNARKQQEGVKFLALVL